MEPRPKPSSAVFTIALIGHRPNRLDPVAIPKVREQLLAVCRAIGDRVAQHDRDAPTALLVPRTGDHGVAMMTSLAEGADRIGADCALACGFPLQVVLPLPRDDFETDFADEASRAEFRRLLDTASRMIALGPPAEGRDSRARAYAMSAEILLDHADVLVAVWDGAPPAGRGGTAMTIDDACKRGMPVIVLDAKGVAEPRLIWHGLRNGALPAADPDMLPSAPLASALADTIERLLRSPAGREADRHHAFTVENVARNNDEAGLLPASARADLLAATYARRFRRAVEMNFLAAFCAISLAVIGLAMLPTMEPAIKFVLLCVEFLLLAFVIVNTWIGRSRDWHRRWIEYREVAERLRVAILLRSVGARAFDVKGEEPRWTGWYLRHALRRAGLPTLELGPAGLGAARAALLSFARGQRRYHENAAHQAQVAERWNEGFGSSAFVSAVVVAIAAIGLVVSDMDTPIWLKATLGSAAIILPALGSALLGIRLLADYAGVAERSQDAAQVFAEIAHHLENDPPDLRHLRARAIEIAEVSLADVATWRVLAESRKLDWPG